MFFIGIDNEINNKFVITLNNNELLSRVDTEYVEIIFKKIGGNTYNKKLILVVNILIKLIHQINIY